MKRVLSTLMFGVLAMSANAVSFPSPEDWRDENIYFIFTDRFNDGDASNNNSESGTGAAYAPTNSRGIHGGDFKGIEKKVDYLKSLGATGFVSIHKPRRAARASSSARAYRSRSSAICSRSYSL